MHDGYLNCQILFRFTAQVTAAHCLLINNLKTMFEAMNSYPKWKRRICANERRAVLYLTIGAPVTQLDAVPNHYAYLRLHQLRSSWYFPVVNGYVSFFFCRYQNTLDSIYRQTKLTNQPILSLRWEGLPTTSTPLSGGPAEIVDGTPVNCWPWFVDRYTELLISYASHRVKAEKWAVGKIT